jgi:hypothetical protein
MSDSAETFRCENCRKDFPVSERAVFPLVVKIISLPLGILPLFPSFLCWPKDFCRACSTQVYLYGGGVFAVIVVLLLVSLVGTLG